MFKFLKALRKKDSQKSSFNIGDSVKYVGHLSAPTKDRVYTILEIRSLLNYNASCYILNDCTIPIFEFELNSFE